METIVNNKLTNYSVINANTKKYCLILHGWGHKSNMWSSFSQLLPKDYGYILLDLPGFGGSQHLETGASVPEYGQFVVDFLNKLKIKKVTIIGHSFGGQIGTYLAINKPELIEKLILVAPAVIRDKGLKQRAKNWLYGQFGFVKKILPAKVIDWIYKKVSSSDYHLASLEKREILKKINKYHLKDKLNNIVCPTLIIFGEMDREINFDGKYLAKNIEKAKLRIIYGGGHNMYLENKDELANTIGGFLK